MHFRITIPSLADGKKDEAVSYVKENVFPEFDGVPGLMSMTAAITGETSGVNMATWESKEAADAVAEKIQAALAGAASGSVLQQFMKEHQYLEKFIMKKIWLVVGVASNNL